jgi:hypothetical protein
MAAACPEPWVSILRFDLITGSCIGGEVEYDMMRSSRNSAGNEGILLAR